MISRGRRKTRSESFDQINITPFTDVLLVLLIIFMITGSTMVATGTTLEGVNEEGVSSETSDDKAVTVWLAADGSHTLQRAGRSLSPSELAHLPREVPLVLSAHGKTSVQTVVSEYHRLKGLGFSKVSWGPPGTAPLSP